MSEIAAAIPIIRTKLHRPPVPADYVRRPRLHEALGGFHSRPLTLVSAAAGYGKSVLVSAWLDELDCRSAWVSLDESDSDLRQFLDYLVAAVQGVFASALAQTQDLLGAANLAPVAVLAGTLINELDELDESLVLVLDDIQSIHDSSVNDLLSELLTHPPRDVHLVLVGRRDPFLPIARLRAGGWVNEIRAQHLRFTVAETQEFLENVMETDMIAGMAAAWTEESEGWVTGLRLVSLAYRGGEAMPKDPSKPWKSRRHALQYLLQEVLERQAPSVVNHLLRSSIADRFCAPLCDAMRGRGAEQDAGGMQGQAFIDWLEQARLFVIRLDEEHVWYRFHHLFQDLLRKEAARRFGGQGLATLHAQASEWFESQGLVEEALHHVLAAGDVEQAVQLVARNRKSAVNADRWFILEKWLSLLPDKVVQQRTELLMARAWILLHQSRFETILPILDHVESQLDDDSAQKPLRGEIALFRGCILYFRGEGAGSLRHIKEALERIPVSYYEARAQSEIIFALASQMEGEKEKALRGLGDLLIHYDTSNDVRKTRLLVTYVFIHIISCDLIKAEEVNRRLRHVAEHSRYVYVEAWVNYLQGLIHLFRYELDAATEFLRRSVSKRFIHFRRAAVDSITGLMIAYQARGRWDEAQTTLQTLREFSASINDPAYSALADSAEARLAILQGRKDPAIRWLESRALPSEEAMLWWLEVPSVTRYRALLAEGSAAPPPSLKEAEKRLQAYAEQNEAHHNTLQLIVILALQAVASEKQGKGEGALTVLERSLELARPGGVIFPFLELGPTMANLLRRLLAEGAGNAGFIKRILTAFYQCNGATDLAEPRSAGIPAPSRQQLPDALTSRELEVLALLEQELYQKEIAERLFVSPETVKTHLKHIYRKLGVSNRRRAVERGRALNLLARR